MLEFKKIVTLKEIACVATVFCYVFSILYNRSHHQFCHYSRPFSLSLPA